jgi:hypothetical protein
MTVAGATTVRLQSLRERTLLVTPVRVGLGLAWVAVSGVAGADAGAAWLAFFLAAFLTAGVLIADPRSRLAELKEPVDAPAGAEVDPPLRQALSALVPSTVVVNVLAGVALARQPVLTALLGGGSAGMGVAGLAGLSRLGAREARAGGVLYVDRAMRTLYVRR